MLNSSIVITEKTPSEGRISDQILEAEGSSLFHSRKMTTGKAPVTLIMRDRGIIFQNFTFQWNFRELKSLRETLT